jgi:DNA-binding FadR family transcriptional regulator
VEALRKRTFRNGRLSGQVVSEIERMIAEEYPQPRLRLPREAQLAERFQVSRIVVREAMKILEERGVVEVRAGRGTSTLAPSPERVKQSLMRLFQDQPIPSAQEMERMLELRQVLEETAAGLAAVRATKQDLQALEAALLAMAQGATEQEIVEADLRFHCAIARSTHNQYFEMVIEPLTHTFMQQIKLSNVADIGVDMHRHIFEAIRARQPVAARQCVRRLLHTTLKDVKRALQALE